MNKNGYSKGKPLLNSELVTLDNGAVIWSRYKDEGELVWNEPFRLWRLPDPAHHTQHAYQDIQFGLTNIRATSPDNGAEHFVSNYSHEPNEQAARDTGDGMFLFHAIKG